MVKSDGTLQLDERLTLPPGRVQVTVQPAAPAVKGNVRTVLERIWADRQTRNAVRRTREEIDSSIQSTREEWEAIQETLERVQDQARQAREQHPC
jgi:hypothetical protein